MEMRDRNFVERLKSHPILRERFESILDIAENVQGDCIKADDAEMQVIEEVRKLGQATLQDWANGQNNREAERILEEVAGCRPYKKNSIGIRHMGG